MTSAEAEYKGIGTAEDWNSFVAGIIAGSYDRFVNPETGAVELAASFTSEETLDYPGTTENASIEFDGVFDGKGFEITCNQFARPLFNFLGTNAVVKNLTVRGAFTQMFNAGLCGNAVIAKVNKGTIENVTSYVTTDLTLESGIIFGAICRQNSLYYPRVKRLSDGALLLCFMNHHFGWDIYTRRSEDNGKTWSDACLILQQYPAESTVGNDMMVFVNPDFIELQDGRIMLAYQWRYKQGYNDLPNTNINCGIGVVFSSDMGRTWTEHRSVYRGRCWEPAMLQLPSGEIQMYITSSQNVVDQTPVVVKTSAKDNWRFDTEKILAEGGPDYPMKKQVNKDLVAYGPYIGKLHIMTGRVNRAKEVVKGEIGLIGIADFDKESNSSWFLGRTLPSAVFYDFGYTSDDFILNTHLYTDKITVFTLENSDSPVVMLARGEDVYKICVNAAGRYEVSELDNNSWHIIRKGDDALVDVVGSINEDKDTDLGYAAQVRVPWEVIGGKPPRNEKIRIHTARWYKGRSKEKHTRRWEELQGEDSDNPSTWLWITLK